MKIRTLSTLDRIECLLYAIREQKGTALPAIQNANQEQVLFWKLVLSECGRKLFNIIDFYHFKRVVADSTIIEEIQIFSDDWILSFAKQPVAWDFANLRKIDPDFESDLSEAILEIGRISRGYKPVLVHHTH
jgi:hypothetical protein